MGEERFRHKLSMRKLTSASQAGSHANWEKERSLISLNKFCSYANMINVMDPSDHIVMIVETDQNDVDPLVMCQLMAKQDAQKQVFKTVLKSIKWCINNSIVDTEVKCISCLWIFLLWQQLGITLFTSVSFTPKHSLGRKTFLNNQLNGTLRLWVILHDSSKVIELPNSDSQSDRQTEALNPANRYLAWPPSLACQNSDQNISCMSDAIFLKPVQHSFEFVASSLLIQNNPAKIFARPARPTPPPTSQRHLDERGTRIFLIIPPVVIASISPQPLLHNEFLASATQTTVMWCQGMTSARPEPCGRLEVWSLRTPWETSDGSVRSRMSTGVVWQLATLVAVAVKEGGMFTADEATSLSNK